MSVDGLCGVFIPGWVGAGKWPMKMEPTVSSETWARTQTPGNYPKRNKLHLEHGESLKTAMGNKLIFFFFFCAAISTHHITFITNPLSYPYTALNFTHDVPSMHSSTALHEVDLHNVNYITPHELASVFTKLPK